LTLNNIVTVKSGLEVTRDHFKMVSLESLATVSYSHSIVTMAVSCIISEIKRDIDRKSRYPLCIRRPRYVRVPVGILPYRLVWKS